MSAALNRWFIAKCRQSKSSDSVSSHRINLLFKLFGQVAHEGFGSFKNLSGCSVIIAYMNVHGPIPEASLSNLKSAPVSAKNCRMFRQFLGFLVFDSIC